MLSCSQLSRGLRCKPFLYLRVCQRSRCKYCIGVKRKLHNQQQDQRQRRCSTSVGPAPKFFSPARDADHVLQVSSPAPTQAVKQFVTASSSFFPWDLREAGGANAFYCYRLPSLPYFLNHGRSRFGFPKNSQQRSSFAWQKPEPRPYSG